MTGIEQFRYDGKRVLVVGGATGMGAAAAQTAAALGAEVIVMDYAPVSYEAAHEVRVDLSDRSSIDSAIDQVDGPIDAIFSAAGVADGPKLMRVNFIGHRHLIDRVRADGKLSRGSAICFISSVAGMGWENDLPLLQEFLATPDYESADAWVAAHEPEGIIHYGFSKRPSMPTWRRRPSPAERGRAHQRHLPRTDRHAAGPRQRRPVAHLRPGLPGRHRLPGPHSRADGQYDVLPQQPGGKRHQRCDPARRQRARDVLAHRSIPARKAHHGSDHGPRFARLERVAGNVSGALVHRRIPQETP